MNTLFLLLGGNLGNIKNSFEKAQNYIETQIGQIKTASKLYHSPAWGFESENDFLNKVLKIETELSPKDVLHQTQNIEKQIGRLKKNLSATFESRVIDIDILYFNSDIIKEDDLVIPHYAMHNRNFTMEPITEIASDFIHPEFQKTNAQLLRDCADKSIVTAL